MMRVRLNGWQRIGIVLSVLWIIVAGLWANYQSIQQRTQTLEFLFQTCVAFHNFNYNDPDCLRDFNAQYLGAIKGQWVDTAIVALVPIPIAWLLAWIVFVVVRWIRRGFD
jgi:hypothetical protein